LVVFEGFGRLALPEVDPGQVVVGQPPQRFGALPGDGLQDFPPRRGRRPA
jgi:hypothetical protein